MLALLPWWEREGLSVARYLRIVMFFGRVRRVSLFTVWSAIVGLSLLGCWVFMFANVKGRKRSVVRLTVKLRRLIEIWLFEEKWNRRVEPLKSDSRMS